MYKVGSARVNELGTATGGRLGDQTGSEICEQKFYIHPKGWFGLAPISPEHGKKMAQAMRDACNNPCAGYTQDLKDRLGVFNWVSIGRKIKDIKEDCGSDCSSLVRACVFEATGKDVGNFSTQIEVATLSHSGLFKTPIEITDESQLVLGMVLVTKTKGHTVIVTEVDEKPNKLHSANSDETEWIVTANEAVIKDGPSDIRKVIAIASKGEKVVCKGFHLNKWLNVVYEKNGTRYTGYILRSNLRQV